MISVNPKDRDVLRFLWVKDPFSSEPEIVVLRFSRVVFGVSASPFLLNATIKHHIEGHAASQPEVVRLLAQSIYVDVCGADREHEACALYTKSKEILSQEIYNECPSLQSLVDSQEASLKNPQGNKPHTNVVEADETYVEATLPSTLNIQPIEHKVLGVRWNVPLDQLVFSLDAMFGAIATVEPSKIVVISLIGPIYDPLGFLSPVTVRFKILMQEQARLGPTVRWRITLEAHNSTHWADWNCFPLCVWLD